MTHFFEETYNRNISDRAKGLLHLIVLANANAMAVALDSKYIKNEYRYDANNSEEANRLRYAWTNFVTALSHYSEHL